MIWVDPPYSPLKIFTSYLRPIHLTIWPIPFPLEKKRILQTTFDSQPRPFQCQHQRRVNGTWGASTCVLLSPCVNDAPSGKKWSFVFFHGRPLSSSIGQRNPVYRPWLAYMGTTTRTRTMSLIRVSQRTYLSGF